MSYLLFVSNKFKPGDDFASIKMQSVETAVLSRVAIIKSVTAGRHRLRACSRFWFEKHDTERICVWVNVLAEVLLHLMMRPALKVRAKRTLEVLSML